MRRRTWAGLVAVVLAGAGAAVAAGVAGHATSGNGWQEVRWPFGRDAWPAGRAFRCRNASCGGEVEVYVRAKRGLCANCATGVVDDAEVDGIADLDMITADFVPRAPGWHVVEDGAGGGLAGRMRTYTLRLPGGSSTAASGILVSRPGRCDLLAVASQGRDAATPEAQAATQALLRSPLLASWIGTQLDGR